MTVIRTHDGNSVYPSNPLPVMLITQPNQWQYAVTSPIAVTTDVVLKGGVSGNKNYCTGFQIINIGTTATEYVIKDNGTVIYRGYASASMTTSDVVVLPTPLRASTGQNLTFACITAGASIYINAQGFQIPV